ncbi:MAG: hypothetical protein Tsb0014_27290 [Pleurocapsa sp.]
MSDSHFINTSLTPNSKGGIDASDRTDNINNTYLGNPAFDTGDFNDESPGNLIRFLFVNSGLVIEWLSQSN